MKSPDESALLIERIELLQILQTEQLFVLKEQARKTYSSLQPAAILKATIHDLTSMPEVKSDLLDGALNITTFLLSKNNILNLFQKPIKKGLIKLLQFIVRNPQ